MATVLTAQTLSVADSVSNARLDKSMDQGQAIGLAIFWTAFIAFAYFVPWMVAKKRHHPQVGPIAMVNFLLGWTLVGWVVALVWAMTTTNQAVVAVAPGLASDQRACGRCGFISPGSAKFCPSCGAQLGTQPAS